MLYTSVIENFQLFFVPVDQSEAHACSLFNYIYFISFLLSWFTKSGQSNPCFYKARLQI